MNLATAKNISNKVINILKPYCKEIKIAGSIRRECENVNDVDIVLIPDSYKLEAYFINHGRKNFEIGLDKINGLRWGSKHKQIRYEGNKIELWLCQKENFGLIYMIRTGSAMFSQSMLARWKQVSKGGYSENGFLHDRERNKINVYSEEEFFKLVKLDFVSSKERSL